MKAPVQTDVMYQSLVCIVAAHVYPTSSALEAEFQTMGKFAHLDEPLGDEQGKGKSHCRSLLLPGPRFCPGMETSTLSSLRLSEFDRFLA
jgi:hypothetical protein